jgi:hypothetical protein
MNDGAAVGLLIILAAVYLLPTLIALSRQHQNAFAIAALNILLGWTLVGWIGSLIWALTAVARRANSAPRSITSAFRSFDRANAAVTQRMEDRRRRADNFQALRAELRARGWDVPPDKRGRRIVLNNPEDSAEIVISATDLSVALRRQGETVFTRAHTTPLDAVDTVYDLFQRVDASRGHAT